MTACTASNTSASAPVCGLGLGSACGLSTAPYAVGWVFCLRGIGIPEASIHGCVDMSGEDRREKGDKGTKSGGLEADTKLPTRMTVYPSKQAG
jgi:hypothetical protein